MLRSLRLQGFKNFRDAELHLGALTLLVGENASGKSNLRDALRFLHGIARGYTLAEIVGEKWIEGGVLQWKGIRGGTREVTYCGRDAFSLEVALAAPLPSRYSIGVQISATGQAPRVIRESLWETQDDGERARLCFDSHPPENPPIQNDPQRLFVRIAGDGRNESQTNGHAFPAGQPVLSQISQRHNVSQTARTAADLVQMALGQLRFLELAPDAMRLPSIPGQDILGDRGENLSSVLEVICRTGYDKKSLLDWVRELTPLDLVDFEFVPDQTGRILATFVESDGRRTSAYSASDGTLRFLTLAAAMLKPDSPPFYFIEELENGIHPTRLHLLLQLIEQVVREGRTQVVATSHSPQLLQALSEQGQAEAVLIYRLEGQPDARIRRIIDIPEARRVLLEQDLARLHASGWLEDAMAFSEGPRE